MARGTCCSGTALLVMGLIVAVMSPLTLAQERQEEVALARARTGTKVSLAQALRASEAQGTPISAKFELDKGKLQLSVYTVKANAFAEVVIDHATAAIAETTPIAGGEDFAAAKAQNAAMAKATRSLRDAVDMALKSNAGFQAVSVSPRAAPGHPTATITLMKGQTFKTVTQPLD